MAIIAVKLEPGTKMPDEVIGRWKPAAGTKRWPKPVIFSEGDNVRLPEGTLELLRQEAGPVYAYLDDRWLRPNPQSGNCLVVDNPKALVRVGAEIALVGAPDPDAALDVLNEMLKPKPVVEPPPPTVAAEYISPIARQIAQMVEEAITVDWWIGDLAIRRSVEIQDGNITDEVPLVYQADVGLAASGNQILVAAEDFA